MSVNLSPVGGAGAQFCDNNGNPLNGGKLYTYSAGTTNSAATYTSAAGSVFHTNPIVLNAGGRVPDSGEIWLSDNISYKFVLKTSADVLIATWDNINGINSNFVNYTIQEEVITATSGQTVFDLSTITYAPATNSLSVYVDGVNQIVTEAYVETDANTVTFVSGLHVGAQVKFTTAVPATGTATNASVVTYDPAGTGAVPTTVQTKLRESVSVKDFGADVTASEATNDAAFAAAFSASTHVVVPASTSYYQISTPIVIPANGVLDIRGARIVSSDGGIIRFAGDGAILGEGAFLRTSTTTPGGSGIALVSPTPTNAAPKIYGFPTISADDGTLDPSIGVDMTGWYGGYAEVRVLYFKNGIYATSDTGQPCYYNELNKPWVRTGSATGATGIKLVKGASYLNGFTIVSPFISGANTARYGIIIDGAGAVNVVGGYVEAFDGADTATRGIYINDASGINIYGVDFDTSSSVANYAIGIAGTCANLNFYGCSYSGGWAATSKILYNPSGNTWSMFNDGYLDRTFLGRTDTSVPIVSGVQQGTTFVGTQRFNGNLIPEVAGNAIDFSIVPDGAGTVTNSKFDVYKEGTWTPTSPYVTFASAYGTYTKIGNMVFAYCSVTFPSTADANPAWITGLPYSPDSVGGAGVNFGGFVTYSTGAHDAFVGGNTASSAAILYDSASAAVAWTNADFSTDTVRLMMIYKHVDV